MPSDSVVAEVRASREAYAARFGFDPVAMVRDLRERERTGGRVVLPPPAAVGRVEAVDVPPPQGVPQPGAA
jgi:hypothetical protein